MPISLRLTSVAYGGPAVGRHQGKTIFVPYAIPGEEVLVDIVQDRGRYAWARLLQVTTASPDRVAVPCPHCGPEQCGGCAWQHMAYPLQLSLKTQVVREQLQRLGGVEEPVVRPALGMDQPWQYRNNVQLVADASGRLGYRSAQTNRTVIISQCPIAHPLLGEMARPETAGGPWRLPAALAGAQVQRAILRAGTQTGQQMLVLETIGEAPGLSGPWPFPVVAMRNGVLQRPCPRDYIEERLGGRLFRVSAGSFFQVNTAQAERLAEMVKLYAGLRGNETLLDCFCGVGTFGLLLANQARRVIGVEESRSAIVDARANVNAAGLANVTLLQGKAERVLASIRERVDVAIVDPPRQGCATAVLAALGRLKPKRIVYVSCDPSTLARDIARLAQAGYALEEATPVDMFPQTYHIETVAMLSRNPS